MSEGMGINGLEVDRIEEELHALIRYHYETGQIPSNADDNFDALESSIPLMADKLINVTSVAEARDEIEKTLDTCIDSDNMGKVGNYIDSFIDAIEDILVSEGFDPDNIDEE